MEQHLADRLGSTDLHEDEIVPTLAEVVDPAQVFGNVFRYRRTELVVSIAGRKQGGRVLVLIVIPIGVGIAVGGDEVVDVCVTITIHPRFEGVWRGIRDRVCIARVTVRRATGPVIVAGRYQQQAQQAD